MPSEEFEIDQKVLLYLDSGDVVGGRVSGKTKDSLELSLATTVLEDWVPNMSELALTKVGAGGDMVIPLSSIIRWKRLPISLI